MRHYLHNSLRALFLSLAVLLSLPMLAVEVEIDGINYELVVKAKQATVIAKTSGKYSGEVVIPESVEHEGTAYSVTSIGDYAFCNCSGLTSVTIGNGVTSIGEFAFYGCSDLTSVSIPNSVTSIGASAFEYCDGLTSVTIPNSVTSIGSSAFSGCHFAKENFINNSSLSAEENNYWGAKLHDYETEEGLLIDSTCVVLCRKNAEIVTIPNSVESIGIYAFSGCSGLTSVTIPNSVTSIWGDAFSGCSALTSVHISDIAAWCNIDFEYNTSNPLFYAHHLYMDGEEVKDLVIPNSVESIGAYAFFGCSGLTSVTIPNSVTSIGISAFSCMLQTIVCNAMNPATIEGRVVCGTNMYNHTQLYVPEGAYWDYAFSDWGNFIRIKEMAMDTEDLESRKAYMIADATGRNFSVYDSAKGCLVNIAYTHALDEESDGSCWTVLKDGAASYLYNIGAKKYGTVSEDGVLTLSDTPMVIDIVNTEDGLSINGKPCMFVLNKNISFDATGIDDLKGENGSVKTAVYDLSGRRVQNAQKGVYIQNGKVVMVR